MSSDVAHAAELEPDAVSLGRFTLGRVLRIMLVTAAALAATAGVLLLVPKSYESSASLLVSMDAGTTPADLEAVMSARAELITSRDLLLAVVDAENLRSVPEFAETGFAALSFVMRLIGQGDSRSLDDTVLANLAERVSVARQPNSSLLRVVARSGDPVLSAGIANSLARTYVNRRTAQTLTDTADANAWLQQEIETQRAKVQQADAAVAGYRSENGLFVGATGSGDFSTVSTQIAEAQQRRNSLEARTKMIRELIAAGQPLDGVADVQKSVLVQGLLQSKARLAAELAEKSTTLLANHPTIKALRAQVQVLDSQIAGEAARVANGLEAEARIEADVEQRLRDELAHAKLVAGDEAKGGVTLAGLEREAETQRDLLDGYLKRMADAATAPGAAATTDVSFVSEAIPSAEPASPNVPLTLGAVGLAALVLQAGALLLADLSRVPAPTSKPAAEPAEESASEPAMDYVTEAGEDAHIEWVAQDRLFEDDDVVQFADTATEDEPELPGLDGPAVPPVATSGDLAELAGSIAARQLRTVFLASVGPSAVAVVAELLEAAVSADLSAVVVDAGSGIVSDVPGLTDLAAGAADYGEVMDRPEDNLAEVKWGRVPALDFASSRPLTLIEALADIYHVVIVDTGATGASSSLPLFAGARASVVLVADDDIGPVAVGQARREIATLGFAVERVVTLPSVRADVA